MALNEEMHIGVLEARNRFSELIRRAAAGATIVVTRHGQPLVRMAAAHPRVTHAEIDASLNAVRDLRASAGFVTSWRESKQDRDDGRRF